MTSETAATAQDYEEQHVHNVYEQIASHFSSTRYKPWPIIQHFLQTLPAGSIGLDVGCGNGKYLATNQDIFILGSDRSRNLTTIAKRHQPHAVCVADILALPHQDARFDFAISIAVLHHLSTPARRIEAVRTVLATLRPRVGRALLYVWALEQEGSRRGWKEGGEQDVMVPWVTRLSKKSQAGDHAHGQQQTADQTFHRYYHLYRKGELTADVEAAGGKVLESGYEKDNWWVIATID